MQVDATTPRLRPWLLTPAAVFAILALVAAPSADAQRELRRFTPAAPTPDQVAAAATDRDLLVLAGAVYDPVAEAPDFESLGFAPPSRGRYGIVQFAPGRAGARAELEGLGVDFLGYLPHGAFQVRWTEAGRARLEAHPDVRWTGDYPPGLKVSPRLWLSHDLPAEAEVSVVGFRGVDAAALAAAVRRRFPAARESQLSPGAPQPVARFSVPRDERERFVRAAAEIAEVAWIEPWLPDELLNDSSVSPIQANLDQSTNATPIWDQDILGTGQIVGVADSGLDRNQCWFTQHDDGVSTNTEQTDADFPVPPATGAFFADRKVVAYWVQPGASEYDNGGAFHGTHVSGTVAGDKGTVATPTEPNFLASDADGMAPNAQILFQDIGNDTTGALDGTAGDDGPMYRQAHAGGARIHNNSWGANTGGAYIASDQQADDALWHLEDMLILFAAGNSGSGASTIGSPGNSKSVLTVGRVDHGNSTAVWPTSSRGPTQDGRTKPEIMAPGSSIRSARGDDNDTTASCPTAAILSGTSMSSPTVAGGAALARQYFTDGFYPTGSRTAADERTPSGPLMKAVLLNGTGLVNAAIPNNDYGWGRIFLDNNLYFGTGERRLRVWSKAHDIGLTTGDEDVYTIVVPSGAELRVTLAWYDPEATLGAGMQLINDLDLEVEGPGPTLYLGNVFSSDQSTTGGTADGLNTVEQVRRASPTAGTYTLRVKGTSVPGNGEVYTDRQGYALVASYGDCAGAVAAAPGGVSATDNGASGIDVGFGAVAGATLYNVYRADGDCGADPASFDFIGTTASTTFTDTLVQGGFDYAYKVRAADGCAEGPLSGCDTATSTNVCDLFPSFDQSAVAGINASSAACHALLTWSPGASHCPGGPDVSYNVYRSAAHDFIPGVGNLLVSGLESTAFEDTSATPLTSYFYVVRAEDGTTASGGPANGGNESMGESRVKVTVFASSSTPGLFADGADSPSLMTLERPWQVTDEQASAGVLSYHNAEDGQNYQAQTCAALTTPEIVLSSSSAVLTYDARWNLESGWDGVVVEISVNGGPWTDLPPTAGYPGSFSSTGSPPVNACAYPASQGAFNGSSGGAFQGFSSTLPASAGQVVRLRWRFSSDPGSEEVGFYLDDVQVAGGSFPDPCVEAIFVDGFESGDVTSWSSSVP